MQSHPSLRFRAGLWMSLTGLSIGWLLGLSQSPVLGPVLAGLVPLLAAFVALTGGVRWKTEDVSHSEERARAPAISSIGLLSIGLAMGATGGMHYRLGLAETHETSSGSTNVAAHTAPGLFAYQDLSAITLPCTALSETSSTSEALERLEAEAKPWPAIAQYISSQPPAQRDGMTMLVRYITRNCR